jgi:hypothetical protein
LAIRAGMVTRWQRAYEAVESGITSPAEVRRVLGWSDQSPHEAARRSPGPSEAGDLPPHRR